MRRTRHRFAVGAARLLPDAVTKLGSALLRHAQPRNRNTSPIGYGFNVQKVTNTTAALTLGAQVDGAVTQTGQQNLYTFTLANASQIYFDSLTNDSGFTWTLTGPRGTEVNARSFQSSDADSVGSSNPVLNLIAGSYTLAVAGTVPVQSCPARRHLC